MANVAPNNNTTKFFSVEILLDPPARPKHPYPLPSVLVIGVAQKHNHLTHTGTEYTYVIQRVQCQGLPTGRNFLNELRAPLLRHFDYLFYNHSHVIAQHLPNRNDHRGEYLRSEDYQFDRGEELREKDSDPSNNL